MHTPSWGRAVHMTPLSTVLPRMRFCLRYMPSTAEGTPLLAHGTRPVEPRAALGESARAARATATDLNGDLYGPPTASTPCTAHLGCSNSACPRAKLANAARPPGSILQQHVQEKPFPKKASPAAAVACVTLPCRVVTCSGTRRCLTRGRPLSPSEFQAHPQQLTVLSFALLVKKLPDCS